MSDETTGADGEIVGTNDELAEIRAMLLTLYDADATEKWLRASQEVFGGLNALELCEIGYCHQVKDRVQALLDGAYL